MKQFILSFMSAYKCYSDHSIILRLEVLNCESAGSHLYFVKQTMPLGMLWCIICVWKVNTVGVRAASEQFFLSCTVQLLGLSSSLTLIFPYPVTRTRTGANEGGTLELGNKVCISEASTKVKNPQMFSPHGIQCGSSYQETWGGGNIWHPLLVQRCYHLRAQY